MKFQTRLIHECIEPEKWNGATLPPIYQNASHCHQSAESMSDTFGGKTDQHIYMRLTNPTNQVLEQKLSALEGGKGAIYMASGMAAVTNTCMALLRAGDEFVCGSSLFMSTYLLFTKVFAKYNLTCRIVDPLDLEGMENSINDKTRFIYLETIGNPAIDIPDIQKCADLAHKHGLPLLVDNTLATPYLCRPLELGANVIIHSTTKYLSGHGDAVGGMVIDGGSFDWAASDRFPDFKPFIERKGELALRDKIWREHHINFGSTPAPFHAYLTFIGLDTLGLRMERHMKNTIKVAQHLADHSKVNWVNYPGLKNHPCRATAEKQFGHLGYGGLLTFGMDDQEACFQVINNLKMIYHLANLGDCKTLIIHPASSQYLSFPEQERNQLGIRSDLLRLSVGIEDVEDICNDIDQALTKL
ncbi:MAG: aminotransferase class I/II-fold pyridoxal phosphate-dependent enzyme [Desulfobulbaceae bacterium]|nr:aminotransferase class I/II-fold pyridoxal phosphate-dependent enzyme [Desulfobulbaceae bacterium]